MSQNIHQLVKEKTKGYTGRYRFTKAKLELPEHFEMNDKIVVLRNEVAPMIQAIIKAQKEKSFALYGRLLEEFEKKGREKMAEMNFLMRQLNRVCKTEVFFSPNIVPTVCHTMIANNLTDATPTNTMLITYFEVGTGTTAPAAGDTALETPVFRNVIASITNSGNVAYATGFIAAAEDDGTYREAGIYSGGSATLGTGILDSHVAINITKSNTETLTIDFELTVQ